MCVGCRRRATPEELVRVVAEPGGGLAVGRNLPGRGAWLCPDSPSCLEAARRRRAFSGALRVDVQPEAIDGLHAKVADRARMV
jgi:predicted RNA-binding protein YlxR (DUF448 family)